jgi:hypothetical protein
VTAVTAQIDDVFRYGGHEYAVAGISEGELFDPSLLDLKPVGHCSACWRGYQAVFALSESRLVLDALHVSLDSQPGLEINNVKPAGPKGQHDWFDNHYQSVNYHLEYTGGVLSTSSTSTWASTPPGSTKPSSSWSSRAGD